MSRWTQESASLFCGSGDAQSAEDPLPQGPLSTPPHGMGDYWDGVGAAWTAKQPQRLWRRFTDHHQLTLVHRLLDRAVEVSAGPRKTLLKTDLFDEVAGIGIVAGLVRAGLRVMAVDVSPIIVAEAVARNPDMEAVVADVRALPFKHAMFDVVFSGSTLDHFESEADINASLVELRRVMRTGGRLILTMDNPVNPLIRLRNGPLLSLLSRIGIVPYQLGVTLGPRALEVAVRKAGFDLVDVTAVLHCPRVIAVAVARVIERLPGACHGAFVRCLNACELLESLPTRWLTGHYIAVCAIAREVEASPAHRSTPEC